MTKVEKVMQEIMDTITVGEVEEGSVAFFLVKSENVVDYGIVPFDRVKSLISYEIKECKSGVSPLLMATKNAVEQLKFIAIKDSVSVLGLGMGETLTPIDDIALSMNLRNILLTI